MRCRFLPANSADALTRVKKTNSPIGWPRIMCYANTDNKRNCGIGRKKLLRNRKYSRPASNGSFFDPKKKKQQLLIAYYWFKGLECQSCNHSPINSKVRVCIAPFKSRSGSSWLRANLDLTRIRSFFPVHEIV